MKTFVKISTLSLLVVVILSLYGCITMLAGAAIEAVAVTAIPSSNEKSSNEKSGSVSQTSSSTYHRTAPTPIANPYQGGMMMKTLNP